MTMKESNAVERILFLIISVTISVGLPSSSSFAAGPMSSENPSTPTTTSNTGGVNGKTTPPTCESKVDEWWSPIEGLINNQCPKMPPLKNLVSTTKNSDGSIITTYRNDDGSVGFTSTRSTDGTVTIIDRGAVRAYIRNPDGGSPFHIIIGSNGQVLLEYPSVSGDAPPLDIPLTKTGSSFSGKLADGSEITFSRNPIDLSWITETKDTNGVVTTTNRNPDGGFTIIKDGIATTKSPDGTWFMTFPKNPDGSTKIYYSDGKTVIKKPDGTIVPQP